MVSFCFVLSIRFTNTQQERNKGGEDNVSISSICSLKLLGLSSKKYLKFSKFLQAAMVTGN